ncbi:MAG: DUF2231 domain-containing protein [Patescibacteria group bacterium]
MNFHPILVHFPVALFTIYALLEIVSLTRLGKLPYAFYVKAIFVILGALSSVPALIAGLAIKPLFGGDPTLVHLVNTHETFAIMTSVLFAILALAYVVAWIHKDLPNWHPKSPGMSKMWDLKVRVAQMVLKPVCIIPLALIGLGLVTVTGALGGAIAYGPNVDPAVSLIYKLLIK